jgi:hypothetical protein
VSYITGAGVPSDHMPNCYEEDGLRLRNKTEIQHDRGVVCHAAPIRPISTKFPHALVLNSFSFIDLPLRTETVDDSSHTNQLYVDLAISLPAVARHA